MKKTSIQLRKKELNNYKNNAKNEVYILSTVQKACVN